MTIAAMASVWLSGKARHYFTAHSDSEASFACAKRVRFTVSLARHAGRFVAPVFWASSGRQSRDTGVRES